MFPGGPPSKYYPGPMMLNFSDLTRTGVFIMVWWYTIYTRKSFYLCCRAVRRNALKQRRIAYYTAITQLHPPLWLNKVGGKPKVVSYTLS